MYVLKVGEVMKWECGIIRSMRKDFCAALLSGGGASGFSAVLVAAKDRVQDLKKLLKIV